MINSNIGCINGNYSVLINYILGVLLYVIFIRWYASNGSYVCRSSSSWSDSRQLLYYLVEKYIKIAEEMVSCSYCTKLKIFPSFSFCRWTTSKNLALTLYSQTSATPCCAALLHGKFGMLRNLFNLPRYFKMMLFKLPTPRFCTVHQEDNES